MGGRGGAYIASDASDSSSTRYAVGALLLWTASAATCCPRRRLRSDRNVRRHRGNRSFVTKLYKNASWCFVRQLLFMTSTCARCARVLLYPCNDQSLTCYCCYCCCAVERKLIGIEPIVFG